MNMDKKLGYMISSVFLFNATLWWAISSLLMPNPDSLLYLISWSFIYIGLIFGVGFVIISFFIPEYMENKPEGGVKNV